MTRHHISRSEIEDAVRRGRARAESEFRARSVRYRPGEDAIEIITTDNAGFLVPRHWIEPLSDVGPNDLSRLELWPGGSAFALAERNVHVSIHGLLTSVLPRMVPGETLASLFARRGGAATSAAKRASARRNGAKGGRPRKAAAGAT